MSYYANESNHGQGGGVLAFTFKMKKLMRYTYGGGADKAHNHIMAPIAPNDSQIIHSVGSLRSEVDHPSDDMEQDQIMMMQGHGVKEIVNAIPNIENE